jgi:hypothetical protein
MVVFVYIIILHSMYVIYTRYHADSSSYDLQINRSHTVATNRDFRMRGSQTLELPPLPPPPPHHLFRYRREPNKTPGVVFEGNELALLLPEGASLLYNTRIRYYIIPVVGKGVRTHVYKNIQHTASHTHRHTCLQKHTPLSAPGWWRARKKWKTIAVVIHRR